MSKNTVKIILIGDTNVGKTCLVRRYLENQYNDTENTIGLEYTTREVSIDSETVNVRIWDTAGQEKYHSLVEIHFTGTDGALVVFDICSKESFNNVQMWIDRLQKKCLDSPAIILVGSKFDLDSQRKVSPEEAYNFAQTMEIDYYDTSAKTGENVNDVFYQIIIQAFNRLKLKKEKSNKNNAKENCTTHKKCSC